MEIIYGTSHKLFCPNCRGIRDQLIELLHTAEDNDIEAVKEWLRAAIRMLEQGER
jgi:hypothetical protein